MIFFNGNEMASIRRDRSAEAVSVNGTRTLRDPQRLSRFESIIWGAVAEGYSVLPSRYLNQTGNPVSITPAGRILGAPAYLSASHRIIELIFSQKASVSKSKTVPAINPIGNSAVARPKRRI